MEYRFTDKGLSGQQSLRGRVFDSILEGILSGRYKAGDALVENRIAEELGVSRTPVREAVRQLEREGLVTSYPNRGVFVNGLSSEDVEDIYRIRALTEGLAVRWAAKRADEDQLRRLEETAELMEYYTRKGNMEQLERLDAQFHSLISEACKSRVLRHILSTLMCYVQQARLGALKTPDRARLALKEHRAILNAVLSGDCDGAEEEMQNHINFAMMNLLEQDHANQDVTESSSEESCNSAHSS